MSTKLVSKASSWPRSCKHSKLRWSMLTRCKKMAMRGKKGFIRRTNSLRLRLKLSGFRKINCSCRSRLCWLTKTRSRRVWSRDRVRLKMSMRRVKYWSCRSRSWLSRSCRYLSCSRGSRMRSLVTHWGQSLARLLMWWRRVTNLIQPRTLTSGCSDLPPCGTTTLVMITRARRLR